MKTLSYEVSLVLSRALLCFRIYTDEAGVIIAQLFKLKSNQSILKTNPDFLSLDTLPFLIDDIPLTFALYEKAIKMCIITMFIRMNLVSKVSAIISDASFGSP